MRISDWSSDVCSSDLTPVGLGLAIMGIIFLRFGYRLLPRDRRAAPTLGEALDVRDYTTEASIGPESSLEGTTVAAFKADLEDVELTGLERDGEHRKKVAGQTLLKDGDTLMLRSEEHTSELQSLMRISYAVFCLTTTQVSDQTHTQRQTPHTSDNTP